MSDPKLEPCPFCGSGAVMRQCDEEGENFGGYYVECIVCHCCTDLRFSCGDDARPLVAEKWNRRAPQPTTDARAEALEAENKRLREALERAVFGLDMIHNSLMRNGPKQASGEMTHFFLEEARAALRKGGTP